MSLIITTTTEARTLRRSVTIATITAALGFAGVAGLANATTVNNAPSSSSSSGTTDAAYPPGPTYQSGSTDQQGSNTPVELTGTLLDGATWLIEKPAKWNGTLVLYGHGMVAPGEANPALDAPDAITGKFLLDHGYALAGSSYATTGFAMEQGLNDQADVVGGFRQQVAQPKTTIAWGTSLGGMVTAGLLERHPELFDGGLSMCGPLVGGVG